MTDVGRHPRIKLYTLSEVVDVKGYVGNFDVKVRKKARYVDEKECTACGENAHIDLESIPQFVCAAPSR